MPDRVIRQELRRALRYARDVAIGRPELPTMTKLIRRDARSSTLFAAVDYVNYEKIPGAFVEFGVFTGISLALLAQGHAFDNKGMSRRIVGFDSFEGLPPASDAHERWPEGACLINHGWHPLLAEGERVTPDATLALFDACGLARPDLHVGRFHRTAPAVIPSQYPEVALVHVDCDLLESTYAALSAVAPALQDGAMLLFDDWFHYRGNPSRGEAGAFADFLAEHDEWRAVHYRSYGTFCNAFILSRR